MKMHARFAILLFSPIFCSGCVTPEGIRLGDVPYVSSTFVKKGGIPDSQTEQQWRTGVGDSDTLSGMIAVGNLSAFREFSQDRIAHEYDDYVAAFELWKSTRGPVLGSEDFSNTMSGWTMVRVLRKPMLAGYIKSLVPAELDGIVDFENAFATFFLGTSRDLVAAKTNADGIFVVTKLLCKDDSEYARCAKNYKIGVFDSATGRQLSLTLGVKRKGARIDIDSFQLTE